MKKKINSAILVTALALSTVAAAEGPAVTPVPATVESPTPTSDAGAPEAAGPPVQVEVFKGPRSKRVKPPAYPSIEQANGRDGWWRSTS